MNRDFKLCDGRTDYWCADRYSIYLFPYVCMYVCTYVWMAYNFLRIL